MIDALGIPQSVLVLGGTSDIGLALAHHYAALRPLRIILAARPTPRRDTAAAELAGAGCPVTQVDFDATDDRSRADVVERAAEGGDIDLVVVAFGLLGEAERAWTDADHARELAEVNYLAPVQVGVEVANRLKMQGHGTIVALSSVAGERVRRSNFVYGSTKAGMDGFYLGLGEALHPFGVRVLVVRPGFVRSKMTADQPTGPLSVTPEHVATAAAAALRDRKDIIWVPKTLRPLMSGLRHTPRALFRRLPI
jgi:decaprenylphospho-beta-D-erythro-pentofuranosid-2-ulose 2-reductase